MNYYTICPCCGYKLFKAGEGSNVEVFCPKCREKLTIEIKDGKLIIQQILSSKTEEDFK